MHWSHLLFYPKEQTNGHTWSATGARNVAEKMPHLPSSAVPRLRYTLCNLLFVVFCAEWRHATTSTCLAFVSDTRPLSQRDIFQPKPNVSESLQIHPQNKPNRNTLAACWQHLNAFAVFHWPNESIENLMLSFGHLDGCMQKATQTGWCLNKDSPRGTYSGCYATTGTVWHKHTHSQSHQVCWLALHVDSCPLQA